MRSLTWVLEIPIDQAGRVDEIDRREPPAGKGSAEGRCEGRWRRSVERAV